MSGVRMRRLLGQLHNPLIFVLLAVAEAYTAANLHDPVLSWVIDDEDARRRLTIGTWPETTVAYLEGILHSGELLLARTSPGRWPGSRCGSGSTIREEPARRVCGPRRAPSSSSTPTASTPTG
ncbi:hypothetical protein L3Q67_41320 [Saccharothrix sp. AJ9571]|nr:hypothetical protein L3Q67_41320 [Saccharothrix sp. AJ9571]